MQNYYCLLYTSGAEEVVKDVRAAYKKTLIVKLSPNVTSIAEIARAVENGGADSVSLINTLLGMEMCIRDSSCIVCLDITAHETCTVATFSGLQLCVRQDTRDI